MNATEQAARWFLRMQEAAPDAPERCDFERWLLAHPRHAEEYRALCDTWEDFDSREQIQRLARAARQRQRRRLASAAVLCIGLLGLLLGLQLAPLPEPPVRAELTHSYAAPQGAHRALLLPDGSRLTLGPASRLDVRFGRQTRRVQLLQGEAYFEVLPHEQAGGRAFVVEAGEARVIVLGTRFVVRHTLEDTVDVFVTEGHTRVGNAHHPSVMDLRAGEAARLQAGLGPRNRAFSPDAALDFTRGRIVFDDATLAEVAYRLSRHRPVPVRLHPSAVAGDRRITAVVQAGEVEDFLRRLPDIVGIEAVDRWRETWLQPSLKR